MLRALVPFRLRQDGRRKEQGPSASCSSSDKSLSNKSGNSAKGKSSSGSSLTAAASGSGTASSRTHSGLDFVVCSLKPFALIFLERNPNRQTPTLGGGDVVGAAA